MTPTTLSVQYFMFLVVFMELLSRSTFQSIAWKHGVSDLLLIHPPRKNFPSYPRLNRRGIFLLKIFLYSTIFPALISISSALRSFLRIFLGAIS